MKSLLQISVLTLIFMQTLAQDFYIPTTEDSCPDNMYFYKDEEDDSRNCICDDHSIFYPGTRRCYRPFRQGPCPSRNYLVPTSVRGIGECEKNPCLKNGFVFFQGRCHIIGRNGPPCDVNQLLDAGIGDFNLDCTYPSGRGGVIDAPQKACNEGFKRTALGCRREFQ